MFFLQSRLLDNQSARRLNRTRSGYPTQISSEVHCVSTVPASGFHRDLIGYGAHPPHPQWPGGARIAVNFVMNHEEGSEYSFLDQDGRSEASLTESSSSPVPVGTRDLAGEGMFEYGSRVGFWRIMRLFRERNLPLTVFACALALERHPPAAAAIRESGHDVCCHGWRWVEHFKLTEAEEREHIRLAIESLKRTVGERPLGWYCRYGPSVNTRRLLMEEGGFLYDSDAYNDDLPYDVRVAGRRHLVIPYAFDTNDMQFYNAARFRGADFADYVIDAFDWRAREGKTAPKMMSVGLHLRLIGRPGRIGALDRILAHMTASGIAWITPRADIARHWLATFPAT